MSASSGGKRLRNKQDKLERIVAAAEKLFSQQDYDATTMGEVARLARVGTGTLFIYADNKRDLVFLICNGWFEAALEHALAVPDELPLLDQLVDGFRPFYDFYRVRRSLAPILLREIFFFAGKHASRSLSLVERMRQNLAARVASARDAGQARADVEPRDAALVCYSTYQIEVRRWVAEGEFDVETGLNRLRTLLAVVLWGIAPNTD